jgi:hypothetical protein
VRRMLIINAILTLIIVIITPTIEAALSSVFRDFPPRNIKVNTTSSEENNNSDSPSSILNRLYTTSNSPSSVPSDISSIESSDTGSDLSTNVNSNTPSGIASSGDSSQNSAAPSNVPSDTIIEVLGNVSVAEPVDGLQIITVPSMSPSATPTATPTSGIKQFIHHYEDNRGVSRPATAPSHTRQQRRRRLRQNNLTRSSDVPSMSPSDIPSVSPNAIIAQRDTSFMMMSSDEPSSGPSLAPSSKLSATWNLGGRMKSMKQRSVSPSTSTYPIDVPSDTPSRRPNDDGSSGEGNSGLSDTPSLRSSDMPSNLPSDIPSSMPSDLPSDTPSGMSSNVPSDRSSDVPSNESSDVPSFVSSDVPSNALSDTPSNASIDIPSNTSSDVPSVVPSDVPSVVPSDVPSVVPSDVPSEMTSDVPSVVPSDVPSVVPSDVPSEMTSDVPSEITSDVPSEIISDVPSERTSDTPSEMTSDIPSEMSSDVPSEMTSDVPSEMTSDVPSEMTSDVPSDMTSDVPSDMPSDMPSVVPSDIPSDAPSSFFHSMAPSIGIVPDSFTTFPSMDDSAIYQFFTIPESIFIPSQYSNIMDKDTVEIFEDICSNEFLPLYLPQLQPAEYKNISCDVISQSLIENGERRRAQETNSTTEGMIQRNAMLDVVLSVSGYSSLSPDTTDLQGALSQTFVTYDYIFQEKLSSSIPFFQLQQHEDKESTNSIAKENRTIYREPNESEMRAHWGAIAVAVVAGAILSVLVSLYVLRRTYYVTATQSNSRPTSSSSSTSVKLINLRNKAKGNGVSLTESEYPGPMPVSSFLADDEMDLESDISVSACDNSLCRQTSPWNGEGLMTNGHGTVAPLAELQPDGTIVRRPDDPVAGVILSASSILLSLQGINSCGNDDDDCKQGKETSCRLSVPRKVLHTSSDDDKRSEASSELEGMKLLKGTSNVSKTSSTCSVAPTLDSILSTFSRRSKKSPTAVESSTNNEKNHHQHSFQMFVSRSSSPDLLQGDVTSLDGIVSVGACNNTTQSEEDAVENGMGEIPKHKQNYYYQQRQSHNLDFPESPSSSSKPWRTTLATLPPRKSGVGRPFGTVSSGDSHVMEAIKKSSVVTTREKQQQSYGRPPTSPVGPQGIRSRSNSISSSNDDLDKGLMTVCSL